MREREEDRGRQKNAVGKEKVCDWVREIKTRERKRAGGGGGVREIDRNSAREY